MKIALVGLGGMGTVHYRNYAHVDGAEVTALVGVGEADERRAGEWGLPLWPSVTEASRHADFGLVDICAPTFLHRRLALESLALRKHTLVEKPMALSYADARAMADAAEENGVRLYVGQVVQFMRETEALREVTQSGRYGKPLDACFERLTACPRWIQGGWLFDEKKSGAIPYDLHIHDLDLIVSLFGEPKTVGYTCCGNADRPYREQYRFTYGYDGLNVSAEAAWYNADIPFTARWRVYYENGLLCYDGQKVIGYRRDAPPETFDTEDPLKIQTDINVPASGWFLRELRHFAARAEAGEPSERVPVAQALGVMSVLERLKER